MNGLMKIVLVFLVSAMIAGCSVFGDNGVESAPYTLLSSDNSLNIEVRNYQSMILVSTSTADGSGNKAFRKLFNYITGDNEGKREIAMTAPVFMDDKIEGTEIAMSAPVFMSENTDSPSMSFVMPSDFTIDTTPKPIDPAVIVSEVTNYKVAAIRFSGTLGESNVDEHTQILLSWINNNGLTQKGKPVKAGYNGPLTLPFLRHNEVLIEIE